MEMGQTPSLKGLARAVDDFKTEVEDMNAAILDKYILATAATIKKLCKAFLLADGGNSEHFFTSV